MNPHAALADIHDAAGRTAPDKAGQAPQIMHATRTRAPRPYQSRHKSFNRFGASAA
jgi:hypothetical protein